MRLLKKYGCYACGFSEWIEDNKSGEKCPECGSMRFLLDVWVAEGKWVEVETSHPNQYKMFKKKEGE